MNKNILVTLETTKEKVISSFYTSNWTEVLKMYKYLKDIGEDMNTYIPVTITDDPDHPNDYSDKEFIVVDLSVQFGGNGGLHSITVYVKDVCDD